MHDTTKVELIRGGQVCWRTEAKSEVPVVEIADSAGLADFSKLRTKAADACIYCGSKIQLSREHVLAYALGGTTTIPGGSCEECRKVTHAFETAVLRGPMQMVRYIQGMPSGTKHRDVPKTIPVKVTVAGSTVKIDAPREDAPILLPFPVFAPPTYLTGSDSELKLCGVVTGSFGIDPKEFGRKHNAQHLAIEVSNNDAIAFGRMIAKTAYANAHVHDQLRRLKDRAALVRALMNEPNTIGRFVGTAPEPYNKYPGLLHRISIYVIPEHRVLYSTVQLFSSVGAPSYIVVLGVLLDDDPITEAD